MIPHYFKLIWNRKKRNGFLLAELTVSFLIFLGIFTFAIDKYKQYRTPRGFEAESVYGIFPGYETNLRAVDSLSQKTLGEILAENLKGLPGIVAVSCSGYQLPYSGSRGSTGYKTGESAEEVINVEELSVDEHFREVWGVKMASGRFFEQNDPVEFVKKMPVVINEKLDKILQREARLSEKFSADHQVIGVVRNFKYDGDFKVENPLMFKPISLNKNSWGYGVYSVKVSPGSGPEVLSQLYKTVERTTKSNDFEIKIMKNEQRKANRSSVIPLLTLLFIGVFLIISISMGLLGVLKYNINSRIPEVGLRKVVGATTADIRKMFVGEMVTLTLIAFVIALLFAVQVPFVSGFPIARSSYFAGMALGALLIFGLVFFCSWVPGRQLAGVLPAEALREE